MRVTYNPLHEGTVKEVIELFPGVGEASCHECHGSGQWDFGPPGTECDCVCCKGTGRELVSI